MQEYALIVNMIPVGVLGASGYAGRELCQLIADHPSMELVFATANDQRGERLDLGGGRAVVFCAPDDAPLSRAALVFSALPHGASKPTVERALAAGVRVVDLSSDFRAGHPDAGDVPYGLTEFAREAVRGAALVANPGCYPTSILVALQPLVRRGRLLPGATIIADSASGVTGAGNSPKREMLFGEITEDFRAYGTGNQHRHLTEMRATLGAWGANADLHFTPHLLPVARGIVSTLTVPVTAIDDDVLAPWREDFAAEPFLQVSERPPALRDVVHRNTVRVYAARVANVRAPMLQVIAAIDNLQKGAAGQALQNANVMLGLPETAGLRW
jgi:N-acetyl-gamma-glutamyl-phosphate reductase